MAQRIEWRFIDDSVIGLGSWYLNWDDPLSSQRLTLTDVIRLADNPVWSLREHTRILGQITSGVDDLLEDMVGIQNADGSPARLPASSPMVHTLVRAYQATQHALALLVDAMVECRKGPIEQAFDRDPALAADVAFTLSDASNCCYRLAMYFPQGDVD